MRVDHIKKPDMEDGLVNPLDYIAKYRVIQWSMLPIDLELEFIMVCYFKAIMKQYGKGGYIYIAARSIKDVEDFDLEEGEMLIIQFAYTAFTTALLALPVRMKQLCTRTNVSEYGDIYIKFIKYDRKHMRIFDLQRRVGTPDNIDLVEDMFKII